MTNKPHEPVCSFPECACDRNISRRSLPPFGCWSHTAGYKPIRRQSLERNEQWVSSNGHMLLPFQNKRLTGVLSKNDHSSFGYYSAKRAYTSLKKMVMEGTP